MASLGVSLGLAMPLIVRSEETLTTEIGCFTRGLTLVPLLVTARSKSRSSTCSLSIEKSSKRFNLLFCKGWVLCILGWHGSANAETVVLSNSSCSWFGFECNFTKVNKPIQINHGLGFSCLIRFPCYAGRLYRASWQWEIDVWCPEDSFSLIWWRVFFTAVENNIWCFPEDTVSRCVFTYICSFDVRVVLSLHCNCGSHRSQLCCF
jgi:hypothetical protein